MSLPDNYYHCFLGNGLDAVLIGRTGLMTDEKISVDRGAWYKSNRYYPEHRLVQVAGRWPEGQPLEHAEGSGWYEAAPLGRVWYDLVREGQNLTLQDSRQRFVPQEGTLYSVLDYGSLKGTAETWLHPTLSLLVAHFTFDQPVEFCAWMAPGVWVEEGWDTDPFLRVSMADDRAEGQYDLGETNGALVLRLEGGEAVGLTVEASARAIRQHGAQFTVYFAIFDNRQRELSADWLDAAVEQGYDTLRGDLLTFWREYFAVSRIEIPDPGFQYFYEASQYHIKAMQNPQSGGLPVNNLRRTWSSHLFWDSYFLQRALLESNHLPEALEGCRFFQRTLDHAQRHAREEFGAPGLKWDWEITHDGRKAYGALLHQKFQVHNNASYANEIWGYYTYTQDESFLLEFYPILEGLAHFFLDGIVQRNGQGYEVGYLVGVHESPIKVRNDGTNVAGALAILRHCASAARILGIDNEITRRSALVADGMQATMDSLFNGRFFQASNDSDHLNMSSVAPIYPMGVISRDDPRARLTTQAFLDKYEGRVVGHGGSENGFPWAAGVLATALALMGEGDQAWQTILSTRPTICSFGGMTEVMDENGWNMQYFGTAEGAVMTAIHNLLLQADEETIAIFPALPSDWSEVSFQNLRALGWLVSAEFTPTRATATVTNDATVPLTRTVIFEGQQELATLEPGQSCNFVW
jgi:hypothetical protein